MQNFTPLGKEGRKKIIDDILAWKREYEMENSQYSDEEHTKFREKMKKKDDSELIDTWKTHVGEWILSRPDVDEKHEGDSDDIVTTELSLLLTSGEETTYGYLGGR